MLVLGYVRVSSIEQEQGFGPEVQANALKAYCIDAELPEPIIISESASAESIVERVELRQILAWAKAEQEKGGQAHVIMYRLDRLARQLTDQESVVSHSMRYGYRLHSTYPAESETLNPAYAGDPMRVAIRQFFGIFSQLERATIQGRLDSGLTAKAKVGGSTGGKLPFGYISRDRDIAIDPDAAPIVELVFELSSHGLDQASIAAYAARQYPQRCGGWQKCQISRMLARRSLYANGLYRSRLGVAEVERPELRILVKGRSVSAPITKPGPIIWTDFPDPLPVLMLSLLLNKPATWIQRQVTDRGLVVSWLKGRMLIRRSDAQQLEHIVAAEALPTALPTA